MMTARPTSFGPPAPLLITTFATWEPHQRSNAADDLVQLAIDRGDLPDRLAFLRHLPVENLAATQRVGNRIRQLRPAAVLCCGMAESRSRLNLERQARLDGRIRRTPFAIARWCDRLAATDTSDDAGQFVCNYLYFQALGWRSGSLATRALFLHVPPLHDANRDAFVRDFGAIVRACQRATAEIAPPASRSGDG